MSSSSSSSKARPKVAPLPMASSLILGALLIISSLPHESLTQESPAGPEARPAAEEPAPARPATNGNSSERVTVIAPRNLRPNSDYHVLVNLADSQQPATIDLQLTGARDSDRELTESKSILANSGETQTVKFRIGDWPAAEYILSVTAHAVDRSWNFTQERTLVYQSKTYSTLIQTDKAIYKPGQLVQFRAIFLTRSLGPHLIKDNSINVTILNPRRSIVKQWSGLSNDRGLLSLDFQLSEDPMLGAGWLIKVASSQQEASKQFTVAEYILPTFDVSVQLPPYASQNESNIVATVKATYTYGKPVRGHVALTVQPLVRFYQLETRPLEQAQYRARLDEAGSADFSVDLMRDLKLERDPFEREIEFFALVEEDLTGRKYNRTGSLKLHERSIKVELLEGDDGVFKPGMGRQVQLKVAYQDDTPVEDNGPPIELRYSVLGQKPLESAKLQPVGGIVEHTFDIPSKVKIAGSGENEPAREVTPYGVELTAQYRGQTYHVSTLRARQSQSQQFMQVSVPQLQRAAAARIARRRNKQTGKYSRPTASVNEDIKIRIVGTEPMQQINCHGLAGGNIVWALSPDAKNKTQFEFEVRVDQRMAPELRVLCFYVRPASKEIIADSIAIPVDGLVRNSVKVSASRDEAKPGQEVEIGVQTKPNALIGLLAIDQSVLLLKSGNDITQKDLLDETRSYGGDSSFSHNPIGQLFTEAIFEDAGVVLLTNNLVDKQIVYDRYYMHSRLAYSMADTSSKIVLDTTAIESANLNPPEFHLNKGPTSEPPVIRSFFPETWIWENATADSSGQFRLKRKAPDTITSWILSAFSIDEQTGFGLSGSRTSVRVFRPFFIKLNLPYSIIRGETVNVQAVIFNYSKRPTQAKVTLDNANGEFEFVGAANSIEDEKYSSASSESKLVRVPAEDGVSVSFLITPKKLGPIDIKMVAQAEFATDAVLRKLLVKPEGQTQHLNRALLVRLPDEAGAKSLDRNISIDIPANAVPGSRKVFVSAVGDLMGPGLSNVDDLLRLPYGCGEQNMINLVPNIVILNYLQNTGRLRESQRSRAVRNIEAGYQRELNYRRNDGSFSAFGNADANGSVWLTAYVLKTFKQAQRFTTVDELVLGRAANFIASLSKSDGSIKEVGMLHHKALASSTNELGGGGGSSVYLTAYSMIALMQQPRTSAGASFFYGGGPFPMVPLDEVLEKGLNYLESRLDEAAAKENPYDLAIIAYALQLANRSSTKDKAYEQLWLKAQQQGDLIWWQPGKAGSGADSDEPAAPKEASGRLIDSEDAELLPSSSSTTSRPPPLKPNLVSGKQSEHQFVPDSLSIEMTAMALLTAIARGGPELERAFPIVSWLISKQNSNGGYASTQDTVLAIEALAAFAEANSAAKSTSAATSLDVDLLYPRVGQRPDSIRKNSVDQLLVNKANALVNQQLRLPDNVTWVQLQASGSGLAVIQVAWQYNLAVSAERPAFYLNPILDKSSTANYLQLSVCTFYKAGDSSNMAVMEVELPSGYTADMEALAGLRRSSEVKRVDTADGDTKIIIYLDKVTRDELCLTIPAHRSSKVSNNKPTPVSIYDYYNRQKAARIFYEPPAASSCDICDSDDCSARCSAAATPKPSDRLISLHDQRKQAEPKSTPDRFANLTLPNGGGGDTRRYTADDYERLLPLAPVLMKLKAAARGLY